MNKDDWTRFFKGIRIYSDKKVKSINLDFVVDQVESGEIRLTDLQLQEGQEVTGTIPATQDILSKKVFSIDETYNQVSGYENIYLGDQPRVYDIQNRFFNIIGRGHETIAIPNVYHEDFTKELVTTGLDLTLYAKDNYDFLRVASFYGDLIDEEENKTYLDESLADHPLNFRYTREFCFSGGSAGDEIKIMASGQYGSVNGNKVPLGVQSFNVGKEVDEFGKKRVVYYKNRQRFMALPVGATRVKIEFYKRVIDGSLEYMVDDGIGFCGIAEFYQWSGGISKL
jgi:hypothetical protein